MDFSFSASNYPPYSPSLRLFSVFGSIQVALGDATLIVMEMAYIPNHWTIDDAGAHRMFSAAARVSRELPRSTFHRHAEIYTLKSIPILAARNQATFPWAKPIVGGRIFFSAGCG